MVRIYDRAVRGWQPLFIDFTVGRSFGEPYPSSLVRAIVRDCENKPAASSRIVRPSRKGN
jgi:hypothetical protein